VARRLFAALLVLAAAAAVGTELAVGSGSGRDLAGTIQEDSFRSTALRGTLHFAVYLPPGYGRGQRYPVIYYLHGLPATGNAYLTFGFVPAALEQKRLRAIVGAPLGARAGDSDPEYLDWGPGRNWETAIAGELPAYVDSHFQTIRRRSGRALIGVSAGGYGAFLLTLHHLASFAVVEPWSGYFHPTDPSGTKPLKLGSAGADARASAHTLVSSLQEDVRRFPTLLAFYVGRGDSRFRQENVQLDHELTAAHVPHVFRLYAGGHSQQLWQSEAGKWLAMAVDHLAAPTKG
jgi:enterochelin esterase-like enzyme